MKATGSWGLSESPSTRASPREVRSPLWAAKRPASRRPEGRRRRLSLASVVAFSKRFTMRHDIPLRGVPASRISRCPLPAPGADIAPVGRDAPAHRLRAHAGHCVAAPAPWLAPSPAGQDRPAHRRPGKPSDLPGRGPAAIRLRQRLPGLRRARVPQVPRVWNVRLGIFPPALPRVWRGEDRRVLVQGTHVPVLLGTTDRRPGEPGPTHPCPIRPRTPSGGGPPHPTVLGMRFVGARTNRSCQANPRFASGPGFDPATIHLAIWPSGAFRG
jgi:hypothetical protein